MVKPSSLKILVALITLCSMVDVAFAQSSAPQPFVQPDADRRAGADVTNNRSKADQKGNLTYSYSIDLPPFFVPFNLSLNYNSGNPKDIGGEVGSGWSLSMPEIRRDMRGTPNDLTDDWYYLSGQKLVRLGDDGTYELFETAEKSFQRIRRVKATDTWEVTGTDGTVMKFNDFVPYPTPPVLAGAQPVSLNATITPNTRKCNNLTNAQPNSYVVNAKGGVPPYTYKWEYVYDGGETGVWPGSNAPNPLKPAENWQIIYPPKSLGFVNALRATVIDAIGQVYTTTFNLGDEDQFFCNDSTRLWDISPPSAYYFKLYEIKRADGRDITTASVGERISYIAIASGGASNYTYRWEYQLNGQGDWQTVGATPSNPSGTNNQVISFTVPGGSSYRLRVSVETPNSPNGQVTDTKEINVSVKSIPYTWRVTEISDVKQNRVRMSYIRQDGNYGYLYLNEVFYLPADPSGVTLEEKVLKCEYTDREMNRIIRTYSMPILKILVSVITYRGALRQKRYEMQYSFDGSFLKYKLNSISEFGIDDSAPFQTFFTYSGGSGGNIVPTFSRLTLPSTTTIDGVNYTAMARGDFNYDLKPDALLLSGESLSFASNIREPQQGLPRTIKTFPVPPFEPQDGQMQSMEINGDGVPDMILSPNTDRALRKHHLYFTFNATTDSNTTQYELPPPVQDSQISGFDYSFVDLNGDGKQDILAAKKSSNPYNSFSVAFSKYPDNPFDLVTPVFTPFQQIPTLANVLNGKGMIQEEVLGQTFLKNRTGLYTFGDMNGDGVPDIIHTIIERPLEGESPNLNNQITFSWNVLFGYYDANNSSMFYSAPQPIGIRAYTGLNKDLSAIPNVPSVVADINNDGVDDMLFMLPFSPHYSFGIDETMKSDVYWWNGATGGHQILIPHNNEVNRYGLTIRDDDHDGDMDIVIFNNSLSTEETVYLNDVADNAANRNLLTSITHATGGTTSISYRKSTEVWEALSETPTGAQWSPSARPSRAGPIGYRPVVASITINDGMSLPTSSSTTAYEYHNAYADRVTKDFRGFEHVIQHNPDSSKLWTTYFVRDGITDPADGIEKHLNDALAGKVKREQVYLKDGGKYQLYRTVHYYYDTLGISNPANNGNPNAMYFTPLAHLVTEQREGANTLITQTSMFYDRTTGNLVRKIDYGAMTRNGDNSLTDADAADTRTMLISYAPPNLTKWIINKPCAEAVFAGSSVMDINDPNFLQKQTMLYDGATDENAIPTEGLQTESRQWFGMGASDYISSKVTYTPQGLPAAQTDPNGATTTFRYDPTYKFYRTQSTNALGHKMQVDYDFTLGKPTRELNVANNISSTMRYDRFGRLTEVRNNSNALVSLTTYYDARNAFSSTNPNRVSTTRYGGDPTKSPDVFSSMFMDGLGRQIQTQTQNGTERLISGMEYDLMSRAWKTYKSISTFGSHADFYQNLLGKDANHYAYYGYYTYDNWWRSSGTVSNAGRFPYSETLYDTLGRPCETYAPGEGARWYLPIRHTYAIDGFRTKHTVLDESNTQVYTLKDAFGRTVQETRGNDLTTTFRYDNFDRLIETRNPEGQVTTKKYDRLSRLIETTTPDGGTTKMRYDAKGQLRFIEDANRRAQNRFVYLKYDKLGRITEEGEVIGSFAAADSSTTGSAADFPTATTPNRIVHIERIYDNETSTPINDEENTGGDPPPNLPTVTNSTVRILPQTKTVGKPYLTRYNITSTAYDEDRFSYDNEGRLEHKQHRFIELSTADYGTAGTEIINTVVRYTYDRQDRLATEDFENLLSPATDGLKKDMSYDAVGRLAEVRTQKNGETTWTREATQTYTAESQLQDLTLGAGTLMRHTYNARGWLVGINADPISNYHFHSTIFGVRYDYTPNGNLQSQEWLNAGNERWQSTYQYDGYNRLTRSNCVLNYNLYGFLEEFTYDRNGNFTTVQRYNRTGQHIDNLSYRYQQGKNQLDYIQDLTNNLSGVKPQTSGNYRFDGNGNLVSDRSKGITSTVYDWRNLPVEVSFINGDYVRYRYNADGKRIYKYARTTIRKPVITSTLSATGWRGFSFSYTIAADNAPTSFGATGLPAGLTIDTVRGTMSGTPQQVGTYNVQLWATNRAGSDTKTLVITVREPFTVTLAINGSGRVVNPYSGGSNYTAGVYRFAGGSLFALRAEGINGGSFTGWSGLPSGNPNEPTQIITVTQNLTLTANFTGAVLPTTYTVSVTNEPLDGGYVLREGQPVSSPFSVPERSSLVLNAVPLSGYQFQQWQINGNPSGTTTMLNLTVGGDLTVVARWQPVMSSPDAPAAPSHFRATALSSSAIRLAWQDNSTNETGFELEWFINGGWEEMTAVGANQTTLDWNNNGNGLQPNTSYLFRIRAYRGNDVSAWTHTSATTLPPSIAPPVVMREVELSVVNPPNGLGWVTAYAPDGSILGRADEGSTRTFRVANGTTVRFVAFNNNLPPPGVVFETWNSDAIPDAQLRTADVTLTVNGNMVARAYFIPDPNGGGGPLTPLNAPSAGDVPLSVMSGGSTSSSYIPDTLVLSAYQPSATARNRIRLTPGFDTRDANGNSRVFEAAIVGGSSAPSADSIVLTTRSDYELGASGNLLVLHTMDNFGRDEREYHHEFGFIDNLGNRTLFVRDMLGSVRAVLKNGTMVEWNDYYAYGAVRDGKSLANGRWKYLGAEADNETGTLHLDTREHDGWVGRWWQVDPLWRLYPHQSPYIYGNANPFRFRDRTGMAPDSLTTIEEIVVIADKIKENVSDVFKSISAWLEENKFDPHKPLPRGSMIDSPISPIPIGGLGNVLQQNVAKNVILRAPKLLKSYGFRTVAKAAPDNLKKGFHVHTIKGAFDDHYELILKVKNGAIVIEAFGSNSNQAQAAINVMEAMIKSPEGRSALLLEISQVSAAMRDAVGGLDAIKAYIAPLVKALIESK